MAAEGGGCRDERRGSSASEVGTDDGTAKKKKKKNSTEDTAISTFSPVSSLSSNGLRMRVCACLCIVRNELMRGVILGHKYHHNH